MEGPVPPSEGAGAVEMTAEVGVTTVLTPQTAGLTLQTVELIPLTAEITSTTTKTVLNVEEDTHSVLYVMDSTSAQPNAILVKLWDT